MPAPKFTPRNYFNAAQEHLGLAVRLREQGEYFTTHFFAGIAVEDILRALSVKEGETFDGTHDIQHWAKRAELLPKGSEDEQNEFRAKIVEVNLRWRRISGTIQSRCSILGCSILTLMVKYAVTA